MASATAARIAGEARTGSRKSPGQRQRPRGLRRAGSARRVASPACRQSECTRTVAVGWLSSNRVSKARCSAPKPFFGPKAKQRSRGFAALSSSSALRSAFAIAPSSFGVSGPPSLKSQRSASSGEKRLATLAAQSGICGSASASCVVACLQVAALRDCPTWAPSAGATRTRLPLRRRRRYSHVAPTHKQAKGMTKNTLAASTRCDGIPATSAPSPSSALDCAAGYLLEDISPGTDAVVVELMLAHFSGGTACACAVRGRSTLSCSQSSP
mmetsp:Transcript_87225/g.244782  ORF Transcript_87225/g.244782 Transcript_87225/m.244782 type:complete len:269 (+) Transcript_87225:1037-1843(+)